MFHFIRKIYFLCQKFVSHSLLCVLHLLQAWCCPSRLGKSKIWHWISIDFNACVYRVFIDSYIDLNWFLLKGCAVMEFCSDGDVGVCVCVRAFFFCCLIGLTGWKCEPEWYFSIFYIEDEQCIFFSFQLFFSCFAYFIWLKPVVCYIFRYSCYRLCGFIWPFIMSFVCGVWNLANAGVLSVLFSIWNCNLCSIFFLFSHYPAFQWE